MQISNLAGQYKLDGTFIIYLINKLVVNDTIPWIYFTF